jgi:hypothetical protein
MNRLSSLPRRVLTLAAARPIRDLLSDPEPRMLWNYREQLM